CHDHKYDPIPTRDYYRMLSAFTTTVRSEVEVDLGTPEEKKATADFEAKLKPLTDEVKRYEEKELPGRITAWVKERKEKDEQPPKVADEKTAAVLKMLWGGKQTFDKLPQTHKDVMVKWFAPQDAGWKERKEKVAALDKHRPKDTKV